MIGFILGLLVIGLVAGLLARAIVPGKDPMSIPATVLLGITGSYLGGLLLGLLLPHRGDYSPAGFFGSLIGAVIALLVHRRVTGRRGASPRAVDPDGTRTGGRR